MRKLAFALLALGMGFASTPSMAASLVYDTFSYSAGNLVPNGGWATFTNPTFSNQGQCVKFVNHMHDQ